VKEIFLLDEEHDQYVSHRIGKLFTNLDLDMNAEIIPKIESIEQIHNCILELGVNEKTLHLVDKNIEYTIKSIESETFKTVVEKLDNFSTYLGAAA
jgi:glutaminase